MITVQQAMVASEFHFDAGCKAEGKQYCARRNGKTQRWKRDTGKFRIPVKYGMYRYGTIDNYKLNNAKLFHTAEECPLLTEKGK